MYDYLEAMKEDVLDYVKWNKDYFDSDVVADRERLEEVLNDDLWTVDSVTGNGSGSYTFNSYKAKEYVTDNMDLCVEMVNEFCIDSETVAEKFLNEEWEYFDVSIRCYLLGQAIGEALDELEEEGFFETEETEETKNPFVEVAEVVANITRQPETVTA